MFFTGVGRGEFPRSGSNTRGNNLADVGTSVRPDHGSRITNNFQSSSVSCVFGNLYNSGVQKVSEVTSSSVEMTKRMASGVVSTSSMLTSVGVDLAVSGYWW